LLYAQPASAQPSPQTDRVAASSWTQELKIPVAIWATAVAGDHVTTYQFRTRYPALLHEENPLVRSLENHPFWMVTANSAIDAATGWAAWKWLGPRHPRLAKLVFYSAAAYRTYLVTHNMRMMGRARDLTVMGR
jgi:hypothetical protein